MTAAFAPFDLDPPRYIDNGAAWERHGLVISGPAFARTRDAPSWLPRARRNDEFQAVLEVRAASRTQSGPARIMTVESDYQHADVVIAQDADDLLTRLRRPGSLSSGDQPFVVPDVFADPGWHRLRVTAADGRLRIVVDSRVRVDEVIGDDPLGAWDTSYVLALGDSVVWNRPWRGDVRVVRAGSVEPLVDYLAPDALEVPARAWYRPQRLQDLVGLDGNRPAHVALLHFVSFLPVGVLAAMLAPRRKLLTATLVSIAFATFVQVGKVFFAGRHPGLVDLVLEAAGGVVGAWCWLRFAPRDRPDRSSASETRHQKPMANGKSGALLAG